MKNIITFLFLFLIFSPKSDAQTASDFTVTTITGETFNLYEKLDEGKYVFLDFYFTTCQPCINMIPDMNAIFETYGCNNSDEVYFMSIDYGDTDADVIQFKDDYGSKLPSASGVEGGGNDVADAYSVEFAPHLMLISPERQIVANIIGSSEESMTTALEDKLISPNPEACSVVSSVTDVFTEKLNVYPNPANDNLILSWMNADIKVVEIHNIFGRKVMRSMVNGAEGNAVLTIDNLPTGAYILTTHTAAGVNGKVLFQKVK